MKPKNRIKIVKRSEREGSRPAADKQESASAPSATQKAAHHVAAWIKEFEVRRKMEARRSFASLFAVPDSALLS